VDLLALHPTLELTLIEATLHERGQGISGIDIVSKVPFRFGHGLFHPDLQVFQVARFPHDLSLLKKLLMQLIDPILVLCLFIHQLFVQLDAAMALAFFPFVSSDIKVIQLSQIFRAAQTRH
jgi:hypothetical protein